MRGIFQQRAPLDPVALFADEYRQLGAWGRFMLWCASPRMARAARDVAAVAPSYMGVQYAGKTRAERPRQDGPLARAADNMVGSGSRR